MTLCKYVRPYVRSYAATKYKLEFGGGVVYCPITVQSYCTRVGNAGKRGGMNGWLIRAQQPRSKAISCIGQTVMMNDGRF